MPGGAIAELKYESGVEFDFLSLGASFDNAKAELYGRHSFNNCLNARGFLHMNDA